jgi:arylformamidase
MKIPFGDQLYFETESSIDLSLPITGQGVKAWYVGSPTFEPVKTSSFIGEVSSGAPVNFRNIAFNPHGNGTHTECLGHITKIIYSVNDVKLPFLMSAVLITIQPKSENGDYIITSAALKNALSEYEGTFEAIIIRTLPNVIRKKTKDYSNSNPPYLDLSCIKVLDSLGVKHLLIDTPSVDREHDEGVLAFHHAFWEVPKSPRFDKTLTELIYVPDEVLDGRYALNLQVAPFENDASPSRPLIFSLKKETRAK